jgi:hypothetical protein
VSTHQNLKQYTVRYTWNKLGKEAAKKWKFTAERFEAKVRPNNIQEFSPYSKRKQQLTIIQINWLMLFKETNHVYSENHTKHKIQN